MYEEPKRGIDGLSLAAVIIVGFIFLSFFVNSGEGSSGDSDSAATPQQNTGLNSGGQGPTPSAPTPLRPNNNNTGDQTILAAPYGEYILTQGQHGFSYGHAAIDISGGKGAPILSPINGIVSENYVDQYGNTTLTLDNARYTVTFLHGNFSANPGDSVNIGDLIGKEGNIGYTMDMAGRLCTNRDCGYHSHLNVFDKSVRQNINPLDYFELQPASQLTQTVWD
jgi:murein DD-endopeptidase MepM/ murein hydrolase activator NlpD